MEKQDNETLMRAFYDPPFLVKRLFPEFYWNTLNNEILLTFDDGPHQGTTEIILECLNKANVKAIFFCVGNNVRKNPGLTKSIIDQGHLLANHTYNHQNVTFLTEGKLSSEIKSVNDLLYNDFNYRIKYFRPPHGRFSYSLSKRIKQHGLQNVMWSLLTFDYKNELNIVKFALQKYLAADSIIVLHDSRKSKNIIKGSIEYIIELSEQREYKIGAPSECLR